MDRTMPTASQAHKDGFQAISPPPRNGDAGASTSRSFLLLRTTRAGDDVAAAPCDQLADAISDRARALSLPAWHLGTDPGLIWPPNRTIAGRSTTARALHGGPLVVPRIPEFPRGSSSLAGAQWAVDHAGDVLRPLLALAIESQDDGAWNLLDARDFGELRRLHLAAARDVVGLDAEDIADALGYSDPSTVRALVREGRRLLYALGAWPWGGFPAGRPPRGWWTHGDPVATALLAWWESPDLLGPGGDALSDLP